MTNLNTCCRTCVWREYYAGVWICDNEYSDNEGKTVVDTDTCPDWEEK